MPQKARKLALKSALSARIDNTVLVKDFSEITEAKTKMVAQSLKALKVEGKILIIANTKAASRVLLRRRICAGQSTHLYTAGCWPLCSALR